MTTKPTWEPLALRCGACKHEWDDWQPMHCLVEVWAAQMRSLQCPACGETARLFMADPKPESDGARDGGGQAREGGFGP